MQRAYRMGMVVESGTRAKHSRNILIVDDEPDILAVMKKSLELEGHTTYAFVNPAAAIEHFRQNPKSYHLVITDIRMPGTNGFELAREIKRINPEAHILLMTAFEINMSEFRKVMPSMKVEGFLKKPIRLAELKAIIQTVN